MVVCSNPWIERWIITKEKSTTIIVVVTSSVTFEPYGGSHMKVIGGMDLALHIFGPNNNIQHDKDMWKQT